MAGDLQSVADSLGRRLQRAVAIDDPQMRLLAYSSHYGHVDRVRTASIMHRRAPAEAIAWVFELGIRDAEGPLRVPANPALGMDERICVPIRAQQHLLGFLWLVETRPPLTDENLTVAAAAAEAAAEILHRERLLGELERGAERELLRDLLSDQPQVREHAANQLVERRLLAPIQQPAVLVVRPLAAAAAPDDRTLVSIGLALDHVRRAVSPRYCLHLVRPDHGLLLVGAEAPSLRPGGVAGLSRQLVESVSAHLPADKGWSTIVAAGESQPRLADAAISYEQARQAARVAEIIPTFRPVVLWSELGIYRMLLQFPIEQLTSSALHPGLVALMQRDEEGSLLGTLETYFDAGCDAQVTVRQLGIHRASLYYRLHRIEEITGTDLGNGDDRLALHLGLKLARLAGILKGARASTGSD